MINLQHHTIPMNKLLIKRFNTLSLLILILFLSNTAIKATEISFQQTDTATSITDTLVNKIRDARATLSTINLANSKGYETRRIIKGISELNNTINPIKKELETNLNTIDKKTLNGYKFVLSDAKNKLDTWQEGLSGYLNSLKHWENQIKELAGDSLLMGNTSNNNSQKLYAQQLDELKSQLKETNAITLYQRDTLNRVMAALSETYSTVTYLENEVLERIPKSGRNELRKESPYLWAAPANVVELSVMDLIRSAYHGQHEMLSLFFNSSWDNRILLLLVTIFFFLWVKRNIRQAESPQLKPALGELKFKYLRPLPVFASLITMLSLIPIFEPSSPSFYIEISQFILLTIITLHFWKSLDKASLKLWLFAVALYTSIILTSMIVNENFFLRAILISLNVISLYFGRRFYKKIQTLSFANKFIKPVFVMYVAFNVIAILLNVFGRITLAKVFSNTAIIGFTQVITLAVFVQVISEALQLQIKISACSDGFFSRINLNKVRLTLKKLWSILALILWLMVSIINLSISGGVFTLLEQILTRPRNFGSIEFTLSNLLLFVVIVYIANMLQKNVGILFGENKNTIDDQLAHKSSKLALLRLVIIFIGVMFAVVASGIPMDKLTVAIGALGVGIGLGLQNIVNNFVSGIILIFERPFRVGDFVELADKKGKVKDIGIRASKMITPQGSEVIIPNGDLLSGRLVNWTLSNDYLKTEIALKINMDADMAVVYKIIEQEIAKAHGTVSSLPPEILVNGVTANSIDIKILVWINNIYIEAGFKSEIYKSLMIRFKAADISII
jgi:potassium efflux system protein